jgi:hypothetical protein
MTPTAFVDESEPGDQRDPGAYILAAVVVDSVEVQTAVSALLAALKPRSAKKLHWTESDSRHRMQVMSVLAGQPVSFMGVVTVTAPRVKSERRRRVTLERLVFELLVAGVDHIVLESRGPADKKDRAHLDALRSRRLIGRVRVDHVPGAAEPMLWAADAACGAINQERRGDQAYRAALGERMVVHEQRR